MSRKNNTIYLDNSSSDEDTSSSDDDNYSSDKDNSSSSDEEDESSDEELEKLFKDKCVIKNSKSQGFSTLAISQTLEFKKSTTKITQSQYYLANHTKKTIMTLVTMNNKAYGEKMQSIVKELLNLSKATHTGHDAQKYGKKFEIKSSRYWVGIKDFKWQHIMENHVYDYILLVGLDFTEIKIYIISKPDFMKLKKSGVVKQQGGAEGQGIWCQRSKIINHLTLVKNISHFDSIIRA